MDIELKKQELREELEKLQYELKEELPKEIAEARELGDLKENAGYHAARERMGFVKAKIIQIMEQIEKLNSIDMVNIPTDKVGYGSKVIISDVNDPDFSIELTFVSEAEANPVKGLITFLTPYGKTLRGHKLGDEVEVELPMGKKKFYIRYLKTIHGNEYTSNR